MTGTARRRTTAFFMLALALASASCESGAGPAAPPDEDEDHSPISYQKRKTSSFEAGAVSFSNEFPGARLNDVWQTTGQLYRAAIDPENIPINNSPWYSFKVWATSSRTIQLTLTYNSGDHRYIPKLSTDAETWKAIDPMAYVVDPDANTATLSLQIGPDTLWVSAQELIAVPQMQAWMEELSSAEFVTLDTIGTSLRGRVLVAVQITDNPEAGRHVLIVGRQHPPEVTGTLALKAFIERFLEDDSLSRRFRAEYVVSAVPWANPDGVDEGHWRHNANGVDLNRDWVGFDQRETVLIRDHFLQQTGQASELVRFGIDFHSTQTDRFYTLSRSLTTDPPGLMEEWLDSIQAHFPWEDLDIRPSGISLPTTKAFFYPAFGCPTVIYEVGDETDRGLIRAKARVAATALMQLLLEL